MTPFNLERALAGYPVVTRDGRPVTQLTKFDCGSVYKIYAVIDGMVEDFTENGNLYSNCEAVFCKECPGDLLMTSLKKTYYINIFRKDKGFFTSGIHENKKTAEYYHDREGFLRMIEIEIEE